MREAVMGLGLAAALAWFTSRILFKKYFMEILQEAFQRADIWHMLMGCLCMAIFVNCEAANIGLFMRTFRRIVPFRHSLPYACAGLCFSAITPSTTDGQPMQLYYMTRNGFGFAQSSFTLLIVTTVYQVSMLLYGTAMVIVRFPFVVAQPGVIHWLLISGILVNGIHFRTILLIILNGPLAERAGTCTIGFLAWIGTIRNKEKTQRRVEGLTVEYSRGGAYLGEYPLMILGMFLRSMIQLTALFLALYFACPALGMGAEPGSFLVMQATLNLAVTAVPLPDSVGVSEGGFTALCGLLSGTGWTFSTMTPSRGISFYRFLAISDLVTAYLQFRPCLRTASEGKQQAIGVGMGR